MTTGHPCPLVMNVTSTVDLEPSDKLSNVYVYTYPVT